MKLNSNLLAKAAGLERLEKRSIDLLERYAGLLQVANQKVNLISRSVSPETEIESQIAISLLTLRLIPEGIASWIDVGSGGGFPVVPLACVRSEISFTAVEPISKKAYFIERTAQDLGLKNLTVNASRIEDVIEVSPRRQWSVVSIKAVTDIKQSLDWGAKLLNSGGFVITYKPASQIDEKNSVAESHGFELSNSLDVKELIDTIDLRIVMYKKS